MRVWVTRAEPGAARTAERLRSLGHEPLVAPLLQVEHLPQVVDLSGVSALTFTSPNGVAAFSRVSAERGLPVFAVGDATAKAARDEGFATIYSAAGDLPALAALLRMQPPNGVVLAPGPEEPSGDLQALAAPVQVRPLVLYRTVATLAQPPETWDAVTIHSARAARQLGVKVGQGQAEGRLACAISAQAAAPIADLPFAAIRIAASPDEDALLEALGKPGPPV